MPSAETLFGTYPLLGCYLIAGADDSDLLFFFMGEMGQSGWMDKVEQQKKRTLGPLQDEARQYIKDSRFELDGFHGSKVNVSSCRRRSRSWFTSRPGPNACSGSHRLSRMRRG